MQEKLEGAIIGIWCLAHRLANSTEGCWQDAGAVTPGRREAPFDECALGVCRPKSGEALRCCLSALATSDGLLRGVCVDFKFHKLLG